MHARRWAELPKRPSPASYAETAEAISAESLSAKIRGETFLEAPRAQPESGLGQSVPQSRSSCAAIVLAALEIVSDLENASGRDMDDETYPFAISPTTSEFERAMIAAFELPRSPSSDTNGHSPHATSPFPNACES